MDGAIEGEATVAMLGKKKLRAAGSGLSLAGVRSTRGQDPLHGLLVQHPEGAARVIEGVITGIGSIGGGAIVKYGTSVLGTATAAGLWAAGAMGVSIGLGAYDLAVAVTIPIFATPRFIAPHTGGDEGPEDAAP